MYAYPLAHSRVEVRSSGGSPDVLILLDGGLSFSQWEEYRDLHGFGLDSQRSRARSIGSLIDFVHAKGDEFFDPASRGQFFQRYAEALLLGTVRSGTDDSGLWWMPRSITLVKQILNEVTAFTEWLSGEHGTAPLNPTRAATRAEQLVFWARWNKRKASSLLRHLKARRRSEPEAVRTPSIRVRHRQSPVLETVKEFPPDRFTHLLRDGFDRGQGQGAEWTTVRDRMIAVLMHGGGIRLSEALHLWIMDVSRDPEDSSAALVRVYHPSEGIIEFTDGAGRKVTRATRAEFLRQRYDRMPLHQMSGGQRVGWKNPLLTDRHAKCFVVFWRHPSYARLFLALYNKYVRIRPRVTTHPYLFVSSELNPMTVKGYEKVHAAAVRRIGDRPAKHLGTTPHGHRHSFGQALADAGVPEKVIQIALHHGSVTSQAVYKEADASKVRKRPVTTVPAG